MGMGHTLTKVLKTHPEIGGRLLFNLCRILSELFLARETEQVDAKRG